MVRDPSLRKKKFEANVDAETLSRQIQAVKPLMVKGEADYFPVIATLEARIKTVIETEAISSIEVRDYLNYGRELYEKSRKFSGLTLAVEAQTVLDKWQSRGLEGYLLLRIAQIFGVTPTAKPPVEVGCYLEKVDSLPAPTPERYASVVYLTTDKHMYLCVEP